MNLDLMGAEPLTGLVLLGALAVLALIDSTSFGTLLIPVWLMLAPGRLRYSRVLIYLLTVALFYLVLGAVLLTIATAWLPEIAAFASTTPFLWAQLIVGAGLLIGSFFMGGRRAKRRGPGRLARWRERAVSDAGSTDGQGSLGSLMALGVTAAGVEVASMLPYLLAIGLLSTSEFTGGSGLLVLVGYCVVMVLPALVLLLARSLMSGWIERGLARISSWMERNAAETTAWIVGILGFLLARSAAVELQLFDRLL
ncbi:GAP family protein [Pseudarthrobacter sp. J75]|uniref:GAP family protein n=1 Tax=unclassified Pseudarthrobacter TaxID=2647000 RepID=UPI002E81A165|nr:MULTISPECIES: GAP family protein [unclassified Pseudarthrobacter]MEE2522106.1 GAP family protein [Pseudarthrobacter sp. J47]MEE2529031.1 GAP family protein [Pseudarthrobacter sp. J75]